MTIREAIDRADQIRPNPFTDGEKERWIKQLEGMIWREVVLRHEGAPPMRPEGLIMPDEYGEAYVLWLLSKIDLANCEYERYNNSAAAFSAAYQSFTDAYNREHMPLTAIVRL